jgi:hypothetical protein
LFFNSVIITFNLVISCNSSGVGVEILVRIVNLFVESFKVFSSFFF